MAPIASAVVSAVACPKSPRTISRVGADDAYFGEGSASLTCGDDRRDAQIREGDVVVDTGT